MDGRGWITHLDLGFPNAEANCTLLDDGSQKGDDEGGRGWGVLRVEATRRGRRKGGDSNFPAASLSAAPRRSKYRIKDKGYRI